MAVKWFKCKSRGVRYREHPTRKHGVRPDRCYSIRYKLDGKDKEEVVGWNSEGINEEIASSRLAEILENIRTGVGPTSLAAKRQIAKQNEEAEKKAKALEEKKNVTVCDYWVNFYEPYAKVVKKASSFRSESGHMKKWILPILGNTPITKIGFLEFDAFVRNLNSVSLSARTKEYIAGTLTRIMRHARDRGIPVEIPMKRQIGIEKVKDNRRLRVLTNDEIKQLLDDLIVNDMFTYRLTRFCLSTGCRLSEAAHLKWSSVNLDESFVYFVNTKNNDSRKVYISDDIVKMLYESPVHTHNELVFPRKDGMSFVENENHSDTPYFFRAAVKKLGLNEGRGPRDRVTFHTIRHTAATRLAKVLDIRSLMDVMGWKVIAMAARYMHTNEDTKREAANILSQSMKS